MGGFVGPPPGDLCTGRSFPQETRIILFRTRNETQIVITATSMSDGGELELATLLEGMTPVLHPDTLVFLHLTNADNPPAEIREKSVFTFREQEGNTFVVEREVVERLGYQYEFPCRRITLNIHSSLQAVGFLSVILRHLADNDIPCNVASGFFHDHLFIPDGMEDKVMEVLEELVLSASREAINTSSSSESSFTADLEDTPRRANSYEE